MKIKSLAISMVFVFLALVSFFAVRAKVSTPQFHQATIESVEDNVNKVVGLTGAAATASAAVSMIPGDTATPIAEKLADFSTYFLVVLCVLYLEKYLVVIFGSVAFGICIPLACVLMIGDQFAETRFWRNWAAKIALAGILVFAMVPASVKVSNMVTEIYQPSISATIDQAESISEDIRNDVEMQGSEDKGLVSGIVDKVSNSLSLAIDGAERLVNRYMEALAVMIVTSCLIPILVFVFFFWLMKVVFGVHIPMSRMEFRHMFAEKVKEV